MKTVYRFGTAVRTEGDLVTVHFNSTNKDYDFLAPQSDIKVGDTVCVKKEKWHTDIVDHFSDNSPEDIGIRIKKILA